MSLITLEEALGEAKKKHYAIGNFDCFNLEMVKGVLAAAEETASPVIIAYGEPFIPHLDIPYYACAVRRMIEDVSVPVVLHTDHFTKTENITRAIASGYTSVMIDASDRPFDENVAVTKAVVEEAHKVGVSVESELGHVSGLEGVFQDDSSIFTSPELAAEFVNKTGIDALAVSIGNVHGVYKAEPKLRFDILEKITQGTAVPLVLHGASGISKEDIRKAVALGITKVNYFTDMCVASTTWIDQEANRHLFDICEGITRACYNVAVEKMKELKNN